MRLKHIKIAGFKSFVDPTTLPLPENMTCIVGPNGCGKSNTIDAVRWVMGESSAKHLRGDSSTDVIFAGSSSRKPVSQASVELLFDNSENRLLGEYAQYTEISVKRVVTRDGQSQYFLNNTKCRRRDITALFLGTGLGSRSYAIIEQGMISNLITAKPEELRVFLEEAAGISKYKERRKETELRMKRTRENLERLFDIREELGRQIQRLEKQAADAETFKTLQAQKRRKQAELAFIRMSKVQKKKGQLDESVRREEVALEVAYSQRREAETAIEEMKQAIQQAQDEFYEKQQAYYQVGTAITKLEEAQKHQERREQSLLAEKSQIETAMATLRSHEDEDRQRQSELQVELDDNEPELEILEDRIDSAQERLEQAQDAMEQWQVQWQSYVSGSASPRETSQVSQVKIQQHEKVISQLQVRRDQLEEELNNLKSTEELALLQSIKAQKQVKADLVVSVQQQMEEHQTHFSAQQGLLDQLLPEASERQAALDQAQGRLHSLREVQSKTLQTNDADQVDWLESMDLHETMLLARQIDVKREWQTAVEKLLGPLLTARLVPEAKSAQSIIQQSPHMVYLLTVDEATALLPFTADAETKVQLPQLHGVIDCKTSFALPSWLHGVFIAETLEQAQEWLDKLQPHESILTQQGHWLGAGWACLGQGDDLGILVLQQDLEDLEQTIAGLCGQVEADQVAIALYRTQLSESQGLLANSRAQLQEHQAEDARLAQQLSGLEAKVEQVTLRRQRVEQEVAEGVKQFELENRQMQQCRQELEVAVASMAAFEDERLRLEDRQEDVQQSVRLCQESLAQDQDRARALVESVKFAASSVEGIDRQLERVASQIAHHVQRLSSIDGDLADTKVDQDAIAGLPGLLQSRVNAEALMSKAKDTLEGHRQRQARQDTLKSEAESDIDRLRTLLEGFRIQVQAQQSDLEHIRQELAEHQIAEDELALSVPDQAQEGVWRRAISELEHKVAALGAINLAAVEEFESQSERKTYMDDQYEDLESALFTLEEAIEKIDQETRERFQTTFTQVNEGMGTLFPRLFGGGQAKLQLVGDDILTAGVAIMEQPPGKKNTSIHMLSGGEKALTAISLVFAIFQLNPSPFCMLDEVDAPLDDANVGRYADMVKHMSETVQFIYISHNKIAMEKAEHLMGVTMQEPGVSRLVSVDMSEASAMTAM